jgi:hypothetical protein
MDTIAFLVALLIGVVLIAWYAFNEARGEDGATGALAITAAASEEDDKEPGGGERRYRIRERLAPTKRAGLRPAEAEVSYRARTPAKAAVERGEPEDVIERDKEY